MPSPLKLEPKTPEDMQFQSTPRKQASPRGSDGLSGIRQNETPQSDGVILLQIDGLAYNQFILALKNGRLPFLKSLLRQGGYQAHPFYAGVPSTTPAVQAELFFGVKTAVPAFQFIERATNRKLTMGFPWPADRVARQLTQRHAPLLTGGRSYSNIYAGGAEEARYCAQTMRLDSLIRALNPLRLAGLLLCNIYSVFTMLAYAIAEAGLAVVDFIRGLFQRKNVLKELKFIPTRVFLCIVLRELIRLRVKMDLDNSVPIIHANFIGYDEQAHRRNPGSAFAHWTLKGIDTAVKDIWRRSVAADRRYHVLIYSDHGQESAVAYSRLFGRPVEQAVRETLEGTVAPASNTGDRFPDRLRAFFQKKAENAAPPMETAIDSNRIQVTAMGPVGHVYLPGDNRGPQKKAAAFRLVREAHIPRVFFVDDQRRVRAITPDGEVDLLGSPAEVLGDAHPYLSHAATDLDRLCRHGEAGDLVISGWQPAGPPLTFAMENGAHGGPGSEETRGFAMFPKEVETPAGVFRALDLRHITRKLMEGN